MSPAIAVLISLSGAPVLGEPVELVLSKDGRPVAGESIIELAPEAGLDRRQRAVGTTDTQGKIQWTPTHSGLVRLEAGGASQVARVRRPRPPASGLAVLAGLILSLGLPFAAIRRRLRGA